VLANVPHARSVVILANGDIAVLARNPVRSLARSPVRNHARRSGIRLNVASQRRVRVGIKSPNAVPRTERNILRKTIASITKNNPQQIMARGGELIASGDYNYLIVAIR
jgi:hypothetical protein